MVFEGLHRRSGGSTVAVTNDFGSPCGSNRIGDIEPFFRRKRWSEGCRSAAPEGFAKVAGRASTRNWEAWQKAIVKIGCGKVTNRTSGLFRPVRLLHLNSYCAGTGPRPKQHPPMGSGLSTDWRRCSSEETKKREFQRQAQVSADHLLARTGVCWGSIDFV